MTDQIDLKPYYDAVEEYKRVFVSKGRSPREKDWHPVRLAVRDVIIALTVFRLEMKSNIILVKYCESYDPFAIPGWSGTKFVTTLLLSQAFKTGSSMGIKFTNQVNNGKVPNNIVSMAESYDVELRKVDQGVIAPREARYLYLALTEFSHEAKQKVMQLAVDNLISPERVCYMVHHSTFAKEEMESILLGSEHPENILGGRVTPQEYFLFSDVVLRMRDTILGGFLDRKLRLKEVLNPDGSVVDLEGNDRYLSILFDAEYFAKIYNLEEDHTPVPWTVHEGLELSKGDQMVVLVRARDSADFEYYFESDLEALQGLMQKYGSEPEYFWLVSRSVLDLGTEAIAHYRNQIESVGANLMVCPETVSLLDQDVLGRLRDAEIMRNEVGSIDAEQSATARSASIFNTTHVRLVALPASYSIGSLKLDNLVKQVIHDERELATGVNKHAVRDRYHRVMDRMQFLAYSALNTESPQFIDVDFDLLKLLTKLWNKDPEQARAHRLAQSCWDNRMLDSDLSKGRGVNQVAEIKRFLSSSLALGMVVIMVQDKHSYQKAKGGMHVVDADNGLLRISFEEQDVPDWVDDYASLPPREVAIERLKDVVRLARRGQAHSFNPSTLSHISTTQAFYTLAYEDPREVDGRKDMAVDIVYTDGSQARPFPLHRLHKRRKAELVKIGRETEQKIGMMSMRHPKMDLFIDRYWFRNIEMSQYGLTSAEVDEKAYQLTKKRLQDMKTAGGSLRMRFYQTGLVPPLVGFWRAVIEYLEEEQGSDPTLEVTPYMYNERKDSYWAADSWS